MRSFKRKIDIPHRIIKTVLAIYISYLAAPFFYADPFFSVLGSLRSMKSSITLSIKELFEQFAANFIAFIFAIFYTTILGISAESVSLAVLSLFITNKYLKLSDSYLSSGFILIALMMLSSDTDDLVIRSISRLYATTFGMVIALFINISFFRPHSYQYIDNLIVKTNQEIFLFLNNNFDNKTKYKIENNFKILKIYLDDLENEVEFRFLLPKKKSKIIKLIDEINNLSLKINIAMRLETLDENLFNSVYPIFIELYLIEINPNNREEKIISIKALLKNIYYNDTSSDDFYTNTTFLSALSKYINYVRNKDTEKKE